MIFRKNKRPPTPLSPSVDILAELEEEAFRAVAEARAKSAVAPPSEPTSEEIEALPIEWEEEEEVYQPESIACQAFLATLNLPDLPAPEPHKTLLLMRREAWNNVRAHLQRNLKVEQGGLLVGRALYDKTLPYTILLLEEAWEAPQGIETSHSFSYTSETWQALFPHLQQMPPNWTILGSYHSHPNLGVFLSRTDLETQETIFPHAWQMALVIDPVREEVGFFVGRDGKPCKAWAILP